MNNSRQEQLRSAIFQSALLEKKVSMLVVFFIFLTSLTSGLFFSLYLPDSMRNDLISPICDLASSDNSRILFPCMAETFPLLLIALCGFSLYGFPLSLFILFTEGAALGFCTGLLLGADVPRLLFSVILSGLLLTPAFILSGSATVNYALINLSASTSQRQCSRDYIFIMLFSLLLLLLSVFFKLALIQI